MVQDIRRIVLSEEELTAAIYSYRRMVPSFIPEGAIKSCRAQDGQGIALTLQVPAGDSTNDVELKLSCVDLLKPVIRFCIESNIMLPLDGKKSIMIDQGKTMLCIILDLSVDCSELVRPMRTSQLMKLSPADLIPAASKAVRV